MSSSITTVLTDEEDIILANNSSNEESGSDTVNPTFTSSISTLVNKNVKVVDQPMEKKGGRRVKVVAKGQTSDESSDNEVVVVPKKTKKPSKSTKLIPKSESDTDEDFLKTLSTKSDSSLSMNNPLYALATQDLGIGVIYDKICSHNQKMIQIKNLIKESSAKFPTYVKMFKFADLSDPSNIDVVKKYCNALEKTAKALRTCCGIVEKKTVKTKKPRVKSEAFSIDN
ncbi:hypothetical protein [Salmon gill poxvirus]|uniref:Uncharacterized protein n=1 Tax=Salmon gill poxvirus TaxID=1680908 RepID=A0A0H4YFQ7_9POXV|nr:hypothetical protein AL387_gp170 [Salmon gill poxvirus]AKR04294.1 hypothetical protein SGPV170 [Salmon gill poxvirus]